MIAWIVFELITVVAEVFLMRETYEHRPSLVGESELDRQARRFKFWLSLAIVGAILLIIGAIYIWKHSLGA